MTRRHGPAGAMRRSAISLTAAALATGAACVLSSCRLRSMADDVRRLESSGSVTVAVAPVAGDATTWAAAWRPQPDGSTAVAGLQSVGRDGIAAFVLRDDGRPWNVGAFTDRNGNRRYDVGEPAAAAADVALRSLTQESGSAPPPLRLALGPARPAAIPPGGLTLPKPAPDLGGALPLHLGEIADPANPLFTAEAGSEGLWTAEASLRAGGIGIWFVEPWDPQRIPVVFVNGIGGSPADFRHLIRNLDRRRFQPWFYHYPSGLPLERSAAGLAGGLIFLHRHLGFPRVDLVAHSMGGLVSRGALPQLAASGAPVRRYLTISTPWGGHEAASSGVRHLRHPVPAWKDMVPGSAFQKQLFRRPLPPEVSHCLVFGYRASSSPFLPRENDGTVSLVSQLHPPAQTQASEMLGLHCDHESILADDATVAAMNRFLAAP